ncbi:MAG TPA: hypothetical protein VGE72_13445 [Azospirillum sp.]
MAQILSFPKLAEARHRPILPAGHDAPQVGGTDGGTDGGQAEALAVFERLMAFHADTQRQMADLMRVGERAAAGRPEAEIVYYPVPRTAALG